MTKLFVVGFPREMDELQLARIFSLYGEIILLTIARDKMSGISKGLGFIQMGAKEAMTALNGYAIGDRQLEVRIADEEPDPSPKPVAKAKPVYVPVSAQPLKKKRPRISK